MAPPARVPFTDEQREVMEEHFKQNERPSDEEVADIAALVKDTAQRVTTWFANRRQKQRKLEKEPVVSVGRVLGV
jgi:hypothetical protein